MDRQKVRIRKAEAGDFEEVVGLCKSSMIATYGSFIEEEKIRPWVEGGETDNYVRSMLNNMLVADDGQSIAGVVAIAEETIDLVWVAIESRGHGLGAALMNAAEAVIVGNGHPAARLEVFEPNRKAIRFYEARGWIRKRVLADAAAGVDKIVMEKELPSGAVRS